MGQRYGIKCSKCDYKRLINLGIGMMYSPKHVFYKGYYKESDKPLLESLVKSKKIIEYDFTLMENGGEPSDDYGHSIYLCTKCGELYSRFHFSIENSDEKYEPKYCCSKCKRVLTRVQFKENKGILKLMTINNESIAWECPKCGNDKLEFDFSLGVMMWD